MQQNINYQQLTEKWAPLLDHEGSEAIKDQHRRNVTAVLLENQEQMLREENNFQSLTEASPTNSAGTGGFSGSSAAAGPVAGFDPVLISLIRRAMPNFGRIRPCWCTTNEWPYRTYLCDEIQIH